MKNSIVFIVFICFYFSIQATQPLFSYGDVSSKIDYSLLDSRFPVMKEWAKAGVEDGIPSTTNLKIVKRITPKANLQKAIDKVAKQGGILLLLPGEYIISTPIQLRSGVVLRGIRKESVLLSVKIHGNFVRKSNKPRQAALFLNNVVGTGIENLTMKYTGVNFEPNDRDSFNSPWEISVYHKPESRDTTLFVEHIWMNQSKNCWVQDCNLLWAGSDPIRITSSEHITCRRNFVDRSYNKNDGGMGYYNIINSQYVLICNEKIKRIRHLAIHQGSKYNVIIHNELEVDINFHDGDGGYNLIEQNHVIIPIWHSWSPVMRGDLSQHKSPGEGNLLFNNFFKKKDGTLIYSNEGECYQMSSDWSQKTASSLFDSLSLKTLYPKN